MENKFMEEITEIEEKINEMPTKDKYRLMFAKAADERDAKKKKQSSHIKKIIDNFKTTRDKLREFSDAIIEEREKEFNYVPENKKGEELLKEIKNGWEKAKKDFKPPFYNDKESYNKAEEIKKLKESLNSIDPNWFNSWEIVYDEKTGASVKPLKNAPNRAIMSATLTEAKPKNKDERDLSEKMNTINTFRKLNDEGKILGDADKNEKVMKELEKDYNQQLTDYALKKMN